MKEIVLTITATVVDRERLFEECRRLGFTDVGDEREAVVAVFTNGMRFSKCGQPKGLDVTSALARWRLPGDRA